jgi:hypothetical protein
MLGSVGVKNGVKDRSQIHLLKFPGHALRIATQSTALDRRATKSAVLTNIVIAARSTHSSSQ